MTKISTPEISLDDIEAEVATEDTQDFEPALVDGTPSGIILFVKSELAPSVAAELERMSDNQRRKAAMAAAQASKSRPGEVYEKSADVMAAFRKAVLLRVAGWRGVKQEFSEENLNRLLKLQPGFCSQIIEKSGEMGRFTPASSTS